MRTKQTFCAGCAMLLTIAWICDPVLGDEGAGAAALAQVSITISNSTYTSVTDYGAGIDLAYGDDSADNYTAGASNSSTHLEFDNGIYDGDLKAGSEGTGIAEEYYHGMSGEWRPYVKARGYVQVWDVWHWAWAHSDAGGDIGTWTPDSNQTVCVTVAHKYALSLVDAHPGGDPMPYQLPEVDIWLTVSFGRPGQELLTAKGGWDTGGAGLEIRRHSETVGYYESSPGYSQTVTNTWWVSVEGGQTYSLLAQAEVDARTPWIPEPATMFLLCGAAVPVLLKRRRS